MEQLTGVYAELAFLDVALNFGQSLIRIRYLWLGSWSREARMLAAKSLPRMARR